jgi:hypothetical protein
VEQLIFAALKQHPRGHTSLLRLTAFVEGIITDLDQPFPWQRLPSRPRRVSVARAVRALERQGFVTTAAIGRSEYPWRGKELWLSTVEAAQLPELLRLTLTEKRAQKRR